MEYIKIIIKGIVQGVGFRPFLFNLLYNRGFKGIITNKGNIGVELIIPNSFDEDNVKIQQLLLEIWQRKPDIAYIEDIQVEKISSTDYNLSFPMNTIVINPSSEGTGEGLTLPPDIALCDYCLQDMRNPSNPRFYNYPFIACAQCGPRFTTVKELPYDRVRTTMNEFEFCVTIPEQKSLGSCSEDYHNFKNRRFHAETFACSRCGPNYYLKINRTLINDSNIQDCNDPMESIKITCELIKKGKVLAIMGIGGVHLVGLADDQNVIQTIRDRKKERKTQPFAIMVKDIHSAERLVELNAHERHLFESFRRPIVLLTKSQKYDLPDNIAPGLNNIGIILPYAGIHHLLFDYLGDIPIIFTSGNVSNIPMAITPKDVVEQLSSIADAYLLHNRIIFQRCDDSVVRVHGTKEKIIRRSRGYVPEYIPLPFETKCKGLIAVGPELSLTGLVARGYRLFPTQHIGNGTSLEIYTFLKESILHLKSLLKLHDNEIDMIAHDMHPLFNSTLLAQEFKQSFTEQSKNINPNHDYNLNHNSNHNFNHNLKTIAVQHHFAHIASLMVDCKIPEHEPVVGVSLDGVGYGTDGHVWGGEIISGTYSDMQREGHLNYIPMIGGDSCVRYPARMLIGFMLMRYGIDQTLHLSEKLQIFNNLKHRKTELNAMINLFQTNNNIALSSSCGRLLDSIASLLEVCQLKTYNGEPAMRLEGFASAGDPLAYDFHSRIMDEISKNGFKEFNGIIPHERIIGDIMDILIQKIEQNPNISTIGDIPVKERANIAASALYSLGVLFAKVAEMIAMKRNIKYIGLSGGVAYNSIIHNAFFGTLRADNALREKDNQLILLEHQIVPPGDAGISIGQAAIAIAKFNQGHNNSKN